MSQHADQRRQQRGIPPIVEQWLDEYGEEHHDGHGALRLVFGKRARRRMERELGVEFVNFNAKWLTVYRVVSAANDDAITVGYRRKRLRRR